MTMKLANRPTAKPTKKITKSIPGKDSMPTFSKIFWVRPEEPAAVTPKAMRNARIRPMRPTKSDSFFFRKEPPSLASMPHIAEMPMRRLFIQPSPDHRVVKPPIPNMAPRCSMAVSRISLTVSPISPSSELVIWDCKSLSKSSRLAKTAATVATISIASGKIDSTE